MFNLFIHPALLASVQYLVSFLSYNYKVKWKQFEEELQLPFIYQQLVC